MAAMPAIGPNQLAAIVRGLTVVHTPEVVELFLAEIRRGNTRPYITINNPYTGALSALTLPYHGVWVGDELVR
jgi:hypothetical protein